MKYEAVIICRTINGREQKTTATVYGSWAVHLSLDPGSREWVITQVTTGLAVPRDRTFMLKKAQAIEIAKALDVEIGARRITRSVGVVASEIIHRVLTGGRKQTLGEQQHAADVAEGCP